MQILYHIYDSANDTVLNTNISYKHRSIRLHGNIMPAAFEGFYVDI